MPLQNQNRPTNLKVTRRRGGLELDHLYIPTSNFDEAWKFWIEVVGLTAVRTWGEGPHRAGQATAGETRFVIARVDGGTKEEFGYTTQHGKPEIFIRTSQIDQQYNRAKSRGAKFVRALFKTHWGPRAFSVEGPDLTVVTFIEPTR